MKIQHIIHCYYYITIKKILNSLFTIHYFIQEEDSTERLSVITRQRKALTEALKNSRTECLK